MQLETLLDIIDSPDDQLILTANRRLSTFIQHRYEQLKCQQGVETWQTPNLMPINAWFRQRYTDALEQGFADQFVLSSFQELCIWENIINAEAFSNDLLKPRATAKSAMQAWQILQQWQIQLDLETFKYNDDCYAFYQWAQAYQRFCNKNNYLDSTQFIIKVCELFENQKFNISNKILLIGFDEMPPYLENFFHTLKSIGTDIQSVHLTNHQNTVNSLGLRSNDDEIVAMAHWAKQMSLEYPDRYIACVVPNLNKLRLQIERQFYSHFKLTEPQLNYNISGGQAFSHHPIIDAAFNILNLFNNTIELKTIHKLLLSPFLGFSEKEFHQRSCLDAVIRSHGEQSLSMKKLIRFCENTPQATCLELNAILNSLTQIFSDLKKKQKPSLWAHSFLKILEVAAWPGERVLSSEEFQYAERWKSLLEEFKQLDLILPPIDYSMALSKLQSLASETVFQSKNEAMNVQVLGLLEAAGSPFDHLWVMDLHDEQWPAHANPNPFIPITLQRDLNMPHASSQKELSFSKAITHHFATSAKQVIFSYPMQRQDQQLSPSPLIKAYAEISSENFDIETDWNNERSTQIQFESIEDYYGPVVQVETAGGGTHLFKLQSACPFRAFAELRLNAYSLDTPEIGLDSMERGNLLHLILEKIWNQLKTQTCLKQIDESALNSLIDKVIYTTVSHIDKKYSDTLQNRFLAIERERLKKLIQNWLELEKQRPEFEVIATEQQRTVQFSGLNIKMKVDRIDQLADGSHCIIDYKSGKPSIHDWFGDRLNEPQLPLYCISHPNHVSALLFAQVRGDDMGYKGMTESEELFQSVNAFDQIDNPFIADSWPQQIEQWQQDLNQLAEDYKQGFAAVDPKDDGDACSYCQLMNLCRIS